MNSNSGRPPHSARTSIRRPIVLGLTLGVALLAGCSKSATADGAKGSGGTPAAATATANPDEKRFPLTGEILRVVPERKLLVVQHDEIKDYMPAMTMEFLVSSGDLALAKPGQKIRAEMIAQKDGEFRLEKIWPNDKALVDAVTAGEKRLREDTHNRGKNAYSGDPHDLAANFVLYDQNGRVVQSAGFRGRQIMLNFIFTRCPVPNMCPAATAKMIAVQRRAREAGVKDLEIVSITLDPDYDTPGVLREYADTRGIDTSNFSFLTGPEKAIRDLLTQFGVISEFKGDILQHTLVTLLIDPAGKIVHRTDLSSWDPEEFVAKMRRS